MLDLYPPLTQLPGSPAEALQRNLLAVLRLRDIIQDLPSTQRWQLPDLVSQAYAQIRAVSHGTRDRFRVPHDQASTKLELLQSLPALKLSAQFSTHKKTLLSLLKHYSKGMERGLQASSNEYEISRVLRARLA